MRLIYAALIIVPSVYLIHESPIFFGTPIISILLSIIFAMYDKEKESQRHHDMAMDVMNRKLCGKL